MDRRVIFDKSPKGIVKSTYIPGISVPREDISAVIPEHMLRHELPLPQLSELDVVRHYSNLAGLNFSVDTNFYPLGSCTMKYNPKINEEMAASSGFCAIHPYQSRDLTQGALELMYSLEKILCRLSGMARFSLQPASGAHGELAGMLIVRKYHDLHGNKNKTKVIIPDSAHGTNPATAAMCGYQTIVIESNEHGLIDIDKLRSVAGPDVAALMLTNPNTLGLFEKDILQITKIIHDAGGLVYYDGANFNALMGVSNPSLMGFDLMHLNLHKTFSTPHGSGGPGAGVVGVRRELADFLPAPLIEKLDGSYRFNYDIKHSIGRVRSFYGNFSVLVRAYAYLLRLGAEGLRRAAQNAVLNANYVREELKSRYRPAYDGFCMHEAVFSCARQKEGGVSAFDIAKRLIDYGIHPPTMYFPLIVKEALMVEPTETESKETLDYFIKAMIAINDEIINNPDNIKTAPHNTPAGRVDEVSAARRPDLRWRME